MGNTVFALSVGNGVSSLGLLEPETVAAARCFCFVLAAMSSSFGLTREVFVAESAPDTMEMLDCSFALGVEALKTTRSLLEMSTPGAFLLKNDMMDEPLAAGAFDFFIFKHDASRLKPLPGSR